MCAIRACSSIRQKRRQQSPPQIRTGLWPPGRYESSNLHPEDVAGKILRTACRMFFRVRSSRFRKLIRNLDSGCISVELISEISSLPNIDLQ